MSSYLAQHLKTPKTQAQKANPAQVKNAAGGYVFQIEPLAHLKRWLVLGSASGTFYASEHKLTEESIEAAREVVKTHPHEALALVVDVSTRNLAPKVDQTIFVYALLLSHDEQSVRDAAYAVFQKIVRTGTHLFQIVDLVNELRGWGRGIRTAIAGWYLGKNAHQLAYQLTKYKQRDGWSHRDVLRLVKAKPKLAYQDALFAYATGRDWRAKLDHAEPNDPTTSEVTRFIGSVEVLAGATDPKLAAFCIANEKLPHECVPSGLRTSPEVWDALVNDMPYHALLRNLSTLARLGVTAPMSAGLARVIEKISKPQGTRVHPITIMLAMFQYRLGKSDKGSSTWTPEPQILKALDDAFYASFGEIEPTGLRQLIAVDISGSMAGSMVAGTNISARTVSIAMASVLAHNEPNVMVRGFTAPEGASVARNQYGYMLPTSGFGGMHAGGEPTLAPLDIAGRRLDDIDRMMKELPMGGTDCSLPIRHALKNKIPVDVFLVLTDSETWAGPIHPHVALKQYRKEMGINAKMIVMALTSTNTTIADPSDPGMLDIVGLSADVPQAIRSFVTG